MREMVPGPHSRHDLDNADPLQHWDRRRRAGQRNRSRACAIGVRYDETRPDPGSALPLRDIAEVYDIAFELVTPPTGGLDARLSIPLPPNAFRPPTGLRRSG
jgi:hypothetical protein